MRRSKRMMEELEQDIRDHIERETQEQHRARDAAGGSALRGGAQVW